MIQEMDVLKRQALLAAIDSAQSGEADQQRRF